MISVAAALVSPAGYPSPSYVPPAPAPVAPVHRTRWSLIVSAIAALVLLAAAAGAAIGAVASHFSSSPDLQGVAGQLAGPSATPTLAPTPGPSPSAPPGPSQSPATLFPSPVISTVPFQPGPPQANGVVSIPVPAGWTVNTQDSNTITLNDPGGYGSVTVGSGLSNPSRTAEQYRDAINAYFQSLYPDADRCPNSTATTGTLNGAAGVFWVLCFTMTAGGQAFPAASAIFAGANSAGTAYYMVSVLTSRDDLQSLVAEAAPVVQGIQWKLK